MARYKVDYLPAGTLQRNANLTAKLRKKDVVKDVVAPCQPDPQGLFWFSEESGLFDATVESAYVLDTGQAGPTLAVAKLLGEVCGEAITWTVSWLGSTPPLWYIDDPYLIVYPDSFDFTADGTLTVRASVAGRTFGPITLAINFYECEYV